MSSKPNLSIKNELEQTVLWLALVQSEDADDFMSDESFPNLLISKNCELNSTDSNGDTLLHLCARQCLEKSAIFLVNKGAKINVLNNDSESCLHLACENGLTGLVSILLKQGADSNIQTSSVTNSQTPMHKAILNNHEDILDLFIRHKQEMSGKTI